MKKMIFTLTLLAGALSQAATLKSSPAEGKVVFRAVGKAMSIEGTGEGPQAEVIVDKTVQGTFRFKLDSLDTKIPMRNSHMKDKYLETGKYPTSELKLADVKDFKPEAASQTCAFTGTLTVHGVEKPVAGNVEIDKAGAGYKIRANFGTKISDFNIPPPSFAGIVLADPITVNVESELK